MKKGVIVCIMGLIFLCVFLLDMCIDKVVITPFAFLHNEEDSYIMLNIRLPRVMTAFLIGGMMGMCGTVMQIITRNPLASPYILGISSGSGLGAALSTFGFLIFSNFGVGISAFIGAVAVSIPIFICILKQSSRDYTLVLTGVAISSLCNAGIAIAQYYATPDQVYQYIFWAMGDLQKSTWGGIVKLLFAFFIGGGLFLFFSRDLDILSMGKVDAASLGVSVEKLILILAIAVCMQTAIAVSIVGIIGFIGLVAPHISRSFLGEKSEYVLLGSIFIASSLLIFADFLSHYFTYPVRFPIGAVTAALGAPFFLWIIHKRNGSND
jgi:iron complex transport system permease protein